MAKIHRAQVVRGAAFDCGHRIVHELDPALRIAALRQQGPLCETRLVLGNRETMLDAAR
jgi:hypothetical protein